MTWTWTCECGRAYEVPDTINADDVATVDCCPACEHQDKERHCSACKTWTAGTVCSECGAALVDQGGA